MRQVELKTTHINKYKNLKLSEKNIPETTMNILLQKEDWWNEVEDTNDGIATTAPFFKDESWYVECHCGKQMNLYSVPENLFSHKCIRQEKCICRNKGKINVEKNKLGNKNSVKFTQSLLVYQCECGLSHAAHQTQKIIENERKRRPIKGKPLGFPCSDICLSYRHLLHQEIDIIIEMMKYDKDKIYFESAKVLDVDIDDAHVGMLGISSCRKLIIYYKVMRGAG